MLAILQQVDQAFRGVLDVVRGDLATVRTGRAKPDLVAHLPIKVESYGSTLALQELANISAPDSSTLVIVAWDKTISEDIVRAIAKSDLHLNPVSDGDVIRITIPLLTRERRAELTKLVEKKVEAGKVLLREERQRIKKEIDHQKGKSGVSEDDIFKAVEELDRKTKEWEDKFEEAGNFKKQELMTV